MKLEIGKYYKTRGGIKCRVICLDARGPRPVIALCDDKDHGFEVAWNMPEGGSVCGKEDPWDIVSEWTGAIEFDWTVVPPWLSHVAMDEDGEWFAYANEPFAMPNGNFWNRADFMVIPPQYAPKGCIDWKQSLMTRPSVKRNAGMNK